MITVAGAVKEFNLLPLNLLYKTVTKYLMTVACLNSFDIANSVYIHSECTLNGNRFIRFF